MEILDGPSYVYFNGNGQLQFVYIGGSYVLRYTTTRRFRDVGVWYCVATADVSLSSPEVKVVNGEEQTALANSTTPSQNADIGWFNAWNFVLEYSLVHHII